uniref:C-type lectin domain-containing protein n=1 Tax=Anopheles farauti TaxID=69004 RepID=A0A182QDF9_9DIPT
MNTAVIVLAVVALAASNLPTIHALRYSVHTTKVTFYEALVQCSDKGGLLASPETPTQNEQIWKAIKTAGTVGTYWIAGSDAGLEGSWIWVTSNRPVGSLNGYVNWDANEPNNAWPGPPTAVENCLSIFDGKPKWNDVPCDKLYNYVCQHPY